MPRKKPKLREDVAERAYRTLQEAIGERAKTIPPSKRTEEQKNPEAVKRGRQGGKTRGQVLSVSRRKRIAKKAAVVRWEKKKG